jgi:hypothetical protein
MYKLLAVVLRTIFRQRVILSKGVARVELLLVCLSKRAKAQGVSRSGISNGITIAFVRKVTFATKAIKAHCEILKGLRPLPFKNARFVERF